MGHSLRLSGHLWSAVLLASAAIVALTAERIAAAPAGTGPGATSGAGGDISAFIAPLDPEPNGVAAGFPLRTDPLSGSDAGRDAMISIAPERGSSTVSTARELTAILIADNKPVAVVNDMVLAVGDTLRDGARVSAIHSDRIWLVEKGGKWRMLTLAAGRP